MTIWKASIFFTCLFFCLYACVSPGTAGHRSIRVSCDFDGGSIGSLKESPANTLTGATRHWKHASSSDDQYYWFYFRMDHVQDRSVTVQLDSLAGIYRGGPHLIYTRQTQPVYSYDRKTWQRIADVTYDTAAKTFTFRNKYLHDSVWVAYAHPYPYSRSVEFIRLLPRHDPHLQTEILGQSAGRRNIPMLTITDSTVPDAGKKVVLITTLQHAGESIGGFFVEGMIRFLLSDHADAVTARRKMIYKIVPMMNPDGIFQGMTRFNGNNEDLNQEWDDDTTNSTHAPTEPEVAALKKWLRNWMRTGRRVDLALDVHSQGQEGAINILHTPANVLTGLTEKLQRYWPVEYIEMTFSGSLNDCWVKEFHIPGGTFEIPQSTVNGGPYLTIDDYHHYGAGTVQGIHDYLFANSSK